MKQFTTQAPFKSLLVKEFNEKDPAETVKETAVLQAYAVDTTSFNTLLRGWTSKLTFKQLGVLPSISVIVTDR